MRALIAIAVLSVIPACRADSIPLATVAADLRTDSPVPFRFGVATDLAANLLAAQSLAPYASAQSLDLSIASVVRAIGIDGTLFVGWAATDPITWLQSSIAIDPAASLVITPSALWFGEQPVTATSEASAGVLLLVAIVIVFVGVLVGKLLKRRREEMEAANPPPPIINTEFGPVTEWARKQAAVNMLADADLRGKVFDVVVRECGGDVVKAAVEFSRRYPELGGTRVDFKS